MREGRKGRRPLTPPGKLFGKKFPWTFQKLFENLLLNFFLHLLFHADCNVFMGPHPHLTVHKLFRVGTGGDKPLPYRFDFLSVETPMFSPFSLNGESKVCTL